MGISTSLLYNVYYSLPLLVLLSLLGIAAVFLPEYLLVDNTTEKAIIDNYIPSIDYFHELVVISNGEVRLLQQDLYRGFLLVSSESVLDILVKLCNVSSRFAVTLEVVKIGGGGYGRESFMVYSSSSTMFESIIRVPGAYLLTINITPPDSYYEYTGKECGFSIKFSLTESKRKTEIGENMFYLLLYATGFVCLIMLLPATWRNKGWGLRGWIIGLSASPVMFFVISLLYVYLVDPFKSRLFAEDIVSLKPAEEYYRVYLNDIYWYLVRSFSPLYNRIFMSTWIFTTVSTTLLLFSTPLETRTMFYELVQFGSRTRVFMYKMLCCVLLPSLAVVSAVVFSTLLVYSNLLKWYFLDYFYFILIMFLVLVVLAFLISTLASLLVMITRNGLVVAFIAGIAVMILFYYNNAATTYIEVINYIILGIKTPGKVPLPHLIHFLKIIGVAIGSLFYALTLYSSREVIT